MKFILVTGTTFSFQLGRYEPARRAAEMAGRALARAGFGLVTGNPPGVDSVAARAYRAECARIQRKPEDGYRQLWLPHFRRGYWLPGAGYRAPEACVIERETFEEWMETAGSLAAAAIMIGGRGGALRIARDFMAAGKPVFPLAFTGGESLNVFYDILRTWEQAPVPGLSRNQFQRLALPWIHDTGPLINLLRGSLADTADVFISYRRGDSAMAAGRLHADLIEHFGGHRVFMDVESIMPSKAWMDSIQQAISACKVGIVMIGPKWLGGDSSGDVRLATQGDVLRREIGWLLSAGKTVMPVLVEGARLPDQTDLPEDLRPLLGLQALALDNANWAAVVESMIRVIEEVLSEEGRNPAPQGGQASAAAPTILPSTM